jgi:dTDP-4-amino-4,6-dideoxygalactose transaminase
LASKLCVAWAQSSTVVSHRGRRIGSFGDVDVFSFHATKFLNALEGGPVVTNDHDIARRVRLMQNFGFDDDDTMLDLDTNGNTNGISMAMTLMLLNSMDKIVGINRDNWYQYRLHRRGAASFQRVVLKHDADGTAITRNDAQQLLQTCLHAVASVVALSGSGFAAVRWNRDGQ